MGTRITVDGVEAPGGMGLTQAVEQVERPPSHRFLVVRSARPESEVLWDGVTPFDPGGGAELVRAEEWKGDPWSGSPESTDARAIRTTGERLDALIGNLRDDLRGFDTYTAAQRQAAQKRALRAVLLIARVVRGDHHGEIE